MMSPKYIKQFIGIEYIVKIKLLFKRFAGCSLFWWVYPVGYRIIEKYEHTRLVSEYRSVWKKI